MIPFKLFFMSFYEQYIYWMVKFLEILFHNDFERIVNNCIFFFRLNELKLDYIFIEDILIRFMLHLKLFTIRIISYKNTMRLVDFLNFILYYKTREKNLSYGDNYC